MKTPALAFFFTFLATACVNRHSQPPPVPLEFANAPPIAPPERCEPSPEPSPPSGHTPLPSASGELSLAQVRGDDRFTLQGYVLFAWSTNGQQVISATQDGILIWSAQSGVLLQHIELGARIFRPSRLLVSPDDEWIALVADMPSKDTHGLEESALFIVPLNREGKVRQIPRIGSSVVFTPDSQRLFTYGHRWDLKSGTHTSLPPAQHQMQLLPDGVRALVFIQQPSTPKQSYIAELRDLASGHVLHRFPPILSSINAALSGDGRRLAFIHQRALSVYSTDDGELLSQIPDIGDAALVHLSHDGRRAITEVLDCAIPLSSESAKKYQCPPPLLSVWDLDTQKPLLQTPQGSGDSWIFSRDGEYLTGSETRLVESLIRIKDGAELRFGSRIRSISPDGRRLIFDGPLGFELASLDGQSPVPQFTRSPRVLARSADGSFRASLAADERLRIENSTSCIRLAVKGQQYFIKPGPYDHIDPKTHHVAFSEDGSALFTALEANSMHARFRAYNANDGSERWSIQTSGRGSGSIHLLPRAGQVLFKAYEHPDIERFDALTGEKLPKGGMPRLAYRSSLRGGAVHNVRDMRGDRADYLVGVVSSRDGFHFASSSFLDNECHLSFWDIRRPQDVDDRSSECDTLRKALSPDETWLAVGDKNSRIHIYSWSKHTSHPSAAVHAGRVTDLVFTPSGARIASSGTDGTIFLIDPKDGSIRGKAILPLDYAERLWISPDGRELVADTARGLEVRLRIEAVPESP